MLVSIALAPEHVEFDYAGNHEKFPKNGTEGCFEVVHRHGTVAVHIEADNIRLGFPTTQELPPNLTATITHRRRSQDLFYPEVLLAVHGPIAITQKS